MSAAPGRAPTAVLIVQDPLLLALLLELIGNLGFQSRSITDTSSITESVSETKPDVIIYHLPSRGCEAELTKLARVAPVVLLTALTSETYDQFGDATRVVELPFQLEQFEDSVRECLAKARASEEKPGHET